MLAWLDRLIWNLVPVLKNNGNQDYQTYWFLSSKSLRELAAQLRLSGIVEDSENYWEWIIGNEAESGCQLDIYRTHKIEEGEETEVFVTRYHSGSIQELTTKSAEIVSKKLLGIGVQKVFYGLVYERNHDKFNAHVLKTWERQEN